MPGLHNFSLVGIFKMFLNGRGKYFSCALLWMLLLFLSCSKYRLQQPIGATAVVWPQQFKNAARQSCDTMHCVFPLSLQWQKRTSTIVGPSMISLDHVVLLPTLDGSLEGYTLASGKSIGKISIRSKVPITCAYHEPYLIALRRSGSDNLICYHLQQAKTIWTKSVGNVATEPLLDGEQIYLATVDGVLLRLRLFDGQIIRKTKINGRFANLALSDKVLVIGDDTGMMRAFDADLKQLWQFDAGSAIRATPVIYSRRIFIGATNGRFYCLDLFSGSLCWQTEITGRIFQTAAVCGEKVVFGATDHKVYCLDLGTGQIIWTFSANSVLSTAPVLTSNAAFIGSMDNTFYALELQSGAKLWDYSAKGRIRSNPIIVHNYLLFAAENDYVYCFKLNKE